MLLAEDFQAFFLIQARRSQSQSLVAVAELRPDRMLTVPQVAVAALARALRR
jgi:hypothetical protein